MTVNACDQAGRVNPGGQLRRGVEVGLILDDGGGGLGWLPRTEDRSHLLGKRLLLATEV